MASATVVKHRYKIIGSGASYHYFEDQYGRVTPVHRDIWKAWTRVPQPA
jgi:hypothetical protein